MEGRAGGWLVADLVGAVACWVVDLVGCLLDGRPEGRLVALVGGWWAGPVGWFLEGPEGRLLEGPVCLGVVHLLRWLAPLG